MGLIMAKIEFNSIPRPALRKATDTSAHPVLDSGFSEPKQIGQDASDFGNASDSVSLPRKEKLVDVTIAIPKSLRKKLKSEAKKQKITIDELIAIRLHQ